MDRESANLVNFFKFGFTDLNGSVLERASYNANRVSDGGNSGGALSVHNAGRHFDKESGGI